MNKSIAFLIVLVSGFALEHVTTPNLRLTKPSAGARNREFTLRGGLNLIGSWLENPASSVSKINGPAIVSKSINGIQMADQFPGSDAGEKIANCIAMAARSYGGICDARGIQEAQTAASGNWFNCSPGSCSNGSKGVQLLLGPSSIRVNSQVTVPEHSGITGICRGEPPGQGSRCSSIQAAANFPANTPVVRLGAGDIPAFGVRLTNLTVDCNRTARHNTSIVGVYSTDIQEKSGLDRVVVSGCANIGIFIDDRSEGKCYQSPCGTSAQNWVATDLEIAPGTGVGNLSTVDFKIYCINNFGMIANSTFQGGGDNHVIGAGLWIAGCSGGVISHSHHEYQLEAIHLGESAVGGLGNSGVYGTVISDLNTNVMCSGEANRLVPGCPSSGNLAALSIYPGSGATSSGVTARGITNNGTARYNVNDQVNHVQISSSKGNLITATYDMGDAYFKKLQLGSYTFATLPKGAPNGTAVYCADCNPTCSAGGFSGRTCFRENSAWTH
jgi:hypothetical protein